MRSHSLGNMLFISFHVNFLSIGSPFKKNILSTDLLKRYNKSIEKASGIAEEEWRCSGTRRVDKGRDR
jgi:hypothetical protein